MRRTAPRRLIAATFAVAGLIALPMPASAGDCKKQNWKDGQKKVPCDVPPPPPPA
jgi:hypothetical protein